MYSRVERVGCVGHEDLFLVLCSKFVRFLNQHILGEGRLDFKLNIYTPKALKHL